MTTPKKPTIHPQVLHDLFAKLPPPPSPHHRVTSPLRAHPLAVGRLVPSSDFQARQERRVTGVPEVGLAPPRHDDPSDQIVQVRRQLTGLAQNSRSNSTTWDLSQTTGSDIVLLQFNGAVADTDSVQIQIGIAFSCPLPELVGVPSSVIGLDTKFQAVLSWGVGNSTFTALADVKHGTVLTLPSNYLSVSIRCPGQTALAIASVAAGAPIPIVTLTVGVAYGDAPAHADRATLTHNFGTIEKQTATPVIEIPNFACSVGILSSEPTFDITKNTVAPVNVMMTGNQGTRNSTIYKFQYTDGTNDGGQQANQFVIPAGANFLQLYNADSSNASALAAVFELDF